MYVKLDYFQFSVFVLEVKKTEIFSGWASGVVTLSRTSDKLTSFDKILITKLVLAQKKSNLGVAFLTGLNSVVFLLFDWFAMPRLKSPV